MTNAICSKFNGTKYKNHRQILKYCFFILLLPKHNEIWEVSGLQMWSYPRHCSFQGWSYPRRLIFVTPEHSRKRMLGHLTVLRSSVPSPSGGFLGFPQDFLGCLTISYGFPMISYGFHMISYGFLRFPMDFLRFPMDFLGFPMDFVGFPWIY